ncbi:MAG: M20/M25/M40 family metallo-hydrolase [Eubacteriales bacterium]|nr:M20/M25/M40 family metallo-hydrolase [Eubacteriales bacterium]
MIDKKISDYIDLHERDALNFLKKLAVIKAPSGNESKRAEFCMDYLRAHGAKNLCTDEAGNVIYAINVNESNRLEVFSAHLDIVFPEEVELNISEKNGRLYCPGIGDDTACVSSLMLTACYLAEYDADEEWKRLRGENAPGLLIVFNTCEEGLGNLKGIKEICRRYSDRIDLFCSFDLGYDSFITSAIGSIRYKISVKTQGGHSFMNFGRANAIERLSSIITKLYSMPLPRDGHNTFNVGLIQGGTSVNTIAQYAEMLFEIRSDRAYYLRYMDEKLQKIIENSKKGCVSVDIEIIGKRPCSENVDPDKMKQLIHRAEKAVKQYSGKLPVQKPGSTDCNIPLSLGIPSVCIGCYLGQGAHTKEEYIHLSSLKTGYLITASMIFNQ